MSVELARKYDINVPRYTSYPTAPHFGDEVDAQRYEDWLSQLSRDEPLSLYFHIPFCDEMCWFCGCYTKIVHRYEPVRDYLDAMKAEITLVAGVLAGRYPVRHLHWGGGSPTMLQATDWHALCDHVRHHFDLAVDAELAAELDPRDATEDYVAALAAAGVNRASIGVQDFDPVVQAAINRQQPFDVVERVCGWLRRHGIDRINLDLMYGLPHQSVERVIRMVDQAVTLAPSRIALFGYAHVPWMKSHQRLIDASALPSSEERWQQLTTAAARLCEHGFVPIGLDHFARPDDGLALALASDRLARNFQGYTTDDAPVLLGFGASAIGALPTGYVQNLSPLKDYSRAVGEGRLPIARGRALTADDRLRRHVIQSLMCRLFVDLADARQALAPEAPSFESEIARLQPYVDDGLVVIDGARVQVTETGRPFVRLVAAAFDAYLKPDYTRHSRAV
jgi:oxygen-independent coproporphyrinogen III oxidase